MNHIFTGFKKFKKMLKTTKGVPLVFLPKSVKILTPNFYDLFQKFGSKLNDWRWKLRNWVKDELRRGCQRWKIWAFDKPRNWGQRQENASIFIFFSFHFFKLAACLAEHISRTVQAKDLLVGFFDAYLHAADKHYKILEQWWITFSQGLKNSRKCSKQQRGSP